MTLGPDSVGLEAKLDALGRSLATEAAEPAEFVGMVRRRRRWIAVRRAGAGVVGVLAMALVVMAAQHQRREGGGNPVVEQRHVARAPTFASMRTVADVDGSVQARAGIVAAPPVARAWERPDGKVGRELAEFK